MTLKIGLEVFAEVLSCISTTEWRRLLGFLANSPSSPACVIVASFSRMVESILRSIYIWKKVQHLPQWFLQNSWNDFKAPEIKNNSLWTLKNNDMKKKWVYIFTSCIEAWKRLEQHFFTQSNLFQTLNVLPI